MVKIRILKDLAQIDQNNTGILKISDSNRKYVFYCLFCLSPPIFFVNLVKKSSRENKL